jgi:aryl-alcohol dehydrogenase-like predicted oxidoreductase
MQYTNFGNTGITVSRLCLGCMSYGGGNIPDWAVGTKGWHVDKAAAREHFRIALDAGINFFDTADVYSDRPKRGDYRSASQRDGRA